MKSLVFTLVFACLASSLFAHAHVSVDTSAGAVGDEILVRVGYSDDATLDADRRMLHDGSPYTVTMSTVQSGGTYDGWFTAAGDINPTSDAFYFTGRLGTGWDGIDTYANPGDFQYEIVSVTPASGSPGVSDATFVITWHGGSADSSEAAQTARSVPVGVGVHRHGYTWYLNNPGSYDITLRAWDASGQFVTGGESDVTFRVTTFVPEPATLSLLGFGSLAVRRRRRDR